MQRLHLLNMRGDAPRMAGERKRAALDPAQLDGPRHAAVAAASGLLVDHAAIRAGERFDLPPRARETLPVDLFARLDDRCRDAIRKIEDLAEDIGDPVLAIEAA